MQVAFFSHKGRQFTKCVRLGSATAWCLDGNGDRLNCEEDMAGGNDCPLGYVRAFPDDTCYKVSLLPRWQV